jgi:hypothetical protein
MLFIKEELVLDAYIHGLYSLAYLFLFLFGIKSTKKDSLLSLKNVLLLVTFGLLYDNTVLAFGHIIGEGAILKGLNMARYWFHAILTPLLVLFAWASARNTDSNWLRGKAAFLTASILTAALIVTELVQNTLGITLNAVRKYGMLSYEAAGTHGPPIMVIGVSFILLIAGIILWKKLKWKWMAIGVIIMIIGSALPIPIESEAATNGFELILLISLWATKDFLDKRA